MMELTRCITLPVGVPIDSSWDNLNASLKIAFDLSTDLANWTVLEMFKADVSGQRMSEEAKKLGGMFYNHAFVQGKYPRAAEWEGCMQSAGCVVRDVARKYGRDRSRFMLAHDHSLLSYRYPTPYPIHNQKVKLSYTSGDFPTVRLPLPGETFALRLKRAAEFGRQLAMFKKLESGEAKKCAAALYRNRKGDLLCKLVGKFPAIPNKDMVHACLLHTDSNSLLVAEIDGRRPVIWNADHLRRWQSVHHVYLQRSGEDMKREHRMDRRQRVNLEKARAERCAKFNSRMDTGTDQIAAQVGRFIERQKVARIIYDDGEKSYMPDGFRWFALQERIKIICEGMGVEFFDGTSKGKVA